jgi:hypothetical protein
VAYHKPWPVSSSLTFSSCPPFPSFPISLAGNTYLVFLSCTQHSMTFHSTLSLLHSFPFDTPLVLQHGYFPLYRQCMLRKLLILSPDPSLLSPLLQPSAQYSTSKIWYSGCRRHDDWCLFVSCRAPTWCC